MSNLSVSIPVCAFLAPRRSSYFITIIIIITEYPRTSGHNFEKW